MTSLLDILTDADGFALLSDTNAADIMINKTGQEILKNKNAADFLKVDAGKNLFEADITNALGSDELVDIVKRPEFAQKNNFETIKMLVQKDSPDDKLPYGLQSVIGGVFVAPKTGDELRGDKAKSWG